MLTNQKFSPALRDLLGLENYGGPDNLNTDVIIQSLVWLCAQSNDGLRMLRTDSIGSLVLGQPHNLFNGGSAASPYIPDSTPVTGTMDATAKAHCFISPFYPVTLKVRSVPGGEQFPLFIPINYPVWLTGSYCEYELGHFPALLSDPITVHIITYW